MTELNFKVEDITIMEIVFYSDRSGGDIQLCDAHGKVLAEMTYDEESPCDHALLLARKLAYLGKMFEDDPAPSYSA